MFFLESVKNHRKSAACIRNATEIMLSYFNGSEKEVLELIKMGGDYAEKADLYFDLSISLHSQAFDLNKIDKNTKIAFLL